jgi:hypothetical protein
VARLTREDALAADDPDDALREPERSARAFQDGSLFDVHLEEAFGQRSELDERGAADAALLFVPEDDGRTLADALDRLDRRDDTERAVELAAVGHGIEMRARPHVRLLGAADQVAGGVDLDRQAGVAHPPGGDGVGLILVLRAADAVGPGAAADGVELLESLEHAHERIISRRRDSLRHACGTIITLP